LKRNRVDSEIYEVVRGKERKDSEAGWVKGIRRACANTRCSNAVTDGNYLKGQKTQWGEHTDLKTGSPKSERTGMSINGETKIVARAGMEMRKIRSGRGARER